MGVSVVKENRLVWEVLYGIHIFVYFKNVKMSLISIQKTITVTVLVFFQGFFELLAELGADQFVCDDLEHLLDRYSRLQPGIVVALGGRDLRLPVVVIEHGEVRGTAA